MSVSWLVRHTFPHNCDYLFSASTVSYICKRFFIMPK